MPYFLYYYLLGVLATKLNGHNISPWCLGIQNLVSVLLFGE